MVMNSAVARKKIENTPDLPTLPSVAAEIIKIANSPSTNAADVGGIIQQDQALTTKVLKLVNSSFYGFPGKIKTIQHAVVIIGFNKVKNIVMAASLFDMTKGRKERILNVSKFWLFSLTAAIGAKVSASHFDKEIDPDDIFVAGLIHSLGALIIDQVFPDEYQQVLELCALKNITNYDAEKEILGFTHCQAGEWVTEKWNLPSILRQSIRYYFKPMLAREEQAVVTSVHVGHVLARALGVGSIGDPYMFELDESLLVKYQITPAVLNDLMVQVLAELKLASEFVSLIEG